MRSERKGTTFVCISQMSYKVRLPPTTKVCALHPLFDTPSGLLNYV